MKKLIILSTLLIAFIVPAKYAVAINPLTAPAATENPFAGLPESTIKKIITLSPKEFEKLTGRHLNLKEKIAFKFLKWKLKKELKKGSKAPGAEKFEKMGRMSMIFGIGAFLLVLLPVGSFLAIPSAILAVVLGIISVNKVEKKTNSILGIVLGSAFLVLLAIVVLAFVSAFSRW